MTRLVARLLAGLFVVGVALGLWVSSEHERERRHARRPEIVVNQLLRMAEIRLDDTIYDLECGDGAVVITAAARFGVHASCFDIYPQRLAEARERARSAGVDGLITFREQFWETVDVAPATVVILWLTNPTGHSANYKLCGQLTRELRPGARIVAYYASLGDWRPLTAVSLRPSPADPVGIAKLWIADGRVRTCLE